MCGTIRHGLVGVGVLVVCGSVAASALAAKPTPEQALTLKPIQADVDYETPPAAEASKCAVQQTTGRDGAGWIVMDGAGQMLRRFVDTNGDNKIDQWCYFKHGVEVYRDLDTNFNSKADQYRWLGTEGMRWGLDDDEDGTIDRWKAISAEEVTAEVVAALRSRDASRFQRVLLNTAELNALGLGEVQNREIAKKVAAAARGFTELAQKQKAVGAETQWLHFGAGRPGVFPAGTDGATKDVLVYDNVSTVIQTGSKHTQLNIGTMIRVGDCWRLIDLPQELLESQPAVAGGFFFQQPAPRVPQVAGAPDAPSEKTQEVLRQLDDLEKKIQAAATAEKSRELNAQRADLLEQLVDSAGTPEDRDIWIRQFADTISAAVQSGRYPAGLERLRKLAEKLAKDAQGSKHASHLAFLIIAADYAQALQGAGTDGFAKVQEKYLAELTKYVQDYPQADDAAEAMLQLAVAEELSGKSEQAVGWYRKIVEQFPTAEPAKKAAGARRRLDSVGQPLQLQGPTLDGKTVSLAAYRGKTVLIHYWASWCEPCKQDMDVLQRLQAKYAKQGLLLLGVNIDSDRALAVSFLTERPLPWPQLFEAGGLESRLAVELGILTLPTMILVDREGNVLNRNIHAGELDEELGKRLR